MEIINKKNIKFLVIIILIIFAIGSYISYIHFSKISKSKSLFDLYLANSYNELSQDSINSNYNFLANSKYPKISFFSDLKLSSIANLDKYNDFEKNLILLKYAILNKDLVQLNSIQSDQFFNQTSKIYYLNESLSNIKQEEIINDDNNFFSKAINFYLNDN